MAKVKILKVVTLDIYHIQILT